MLWFSRPDRLKPRNAQVRRHAIRRFFETDFEIVTKISASLRGGPASSPESAVRMARRDGPSLFSAHVGDPTAPVRFAAWGVPMVILR